MTFDEDDDLYIITVDHRFVYICARIPSTTNIEEKKKIGQSYIGESFPSGKNFVS